MRLIETPPIRRLFIPKDGYCLFEGDLRRADPQICAKESGEESLLQVFRDGLDVYCFSGDTEVLTRSGWIPLSEYNQKDNILQCSTLGTANFVMPISFHKMPYKGNLINIKTKNTDHLVTPNHRIPLFTFHNKKTWFVEEAGSFPITRNISSLRLPTSTLKIDGDTDLDDDFIRLLVAAQADGHFTKRGTTTFEFKRQDKIDRLQRIVDNLKVKYNRYLNRRGTTTFTLRVKVTMELIKYLTKNKSWSSHLLTMSAKQFKLILEEMAFWDGSISGKTYLYSQVRRDEAVDWMHTIAHLSGYKAQTGRYQKIKDIDDTEVYRLTYSHELAADSIVSCEIETIPYEGSVYCISVPSTFLLVKRNGKIFVSGNSDMAKWLYEVSKITQEQRQWNKNAINGINYSAQAKTMATTLHTTEEKAKKYIERWRGSTGLYPGIGRWHRRVDEQLHKTRTVRNVYGYRRFYTDRLENLLPKALAWICSSAVSVTIDRGMKHVFGPNVYGNRVAKEDRVDPWSGREYIALSELELLMQIHDSIIGQFPAEMVDEIMPKIVERMEVEIPYADTPLVIPVSLKVGTKGESWGDLQSWSIAA